MTRGRSGHQVTKIMSPEVGKWVTVNVNGNAHHEARILISPYTMRQFDNLLSHLTDKLKPPFGAVWHLFAEDGTEIKDLDDVMGGHTYIASGRSRPVFPARAKRRSDIERFEHRSHSAVGAVRGHGARPGGMADAASDTNVKHAPAPGSTRPCRSSRAKARASRVGEPDESVEQVWDGTLHNQQQYHYQVKDRHPSLPTKKKPGVGKANPVAGFGNYEDVERMEGISFKSPMQSANDSKVF